MGDSFSSVLWSNDFAGNQVEESIAFKTVLTFCLYTDIEGQKQSIGSQ